MLGTTPQGADLLSASPWVWNEGAAGQANLAQARERAGEDDLLALAGFAGAVAGGSAGDGVHFADFPPIRRAPADAGFNLLDPAAAISGDSVRAVPWPAAPLPGDDALWLEPIRSAETLSAEQIDQILDALDERLELMLLRMYGTSTL